VMAIAKTPSLKASTRLVIMRWTGGKPCYLEI